MLLYGGILPYSLKLSNLLVIISVCTCAQWLSSRLIEEVVREIADSVAVRDSLITPPCVSPS